MKMDDKKLEQYLHLSKIPDPNPSLQQRIILAARSRKPQNIMENILNIFQEFLIPKPQYVIALSLIIGVTIGINVSVNGDNNEDQINEFLYLSEEI